jgi:hypothetical protein
VVELCEIGMLRHTRVGSLWLIEPDSVEELRAARREWRERVMTIEQAVEGTGWPRWVLLDLVETGLLAVADDAMADSFDHRSKLIDRDQLADVVASAASEPGVCGVCGEGLPYARRFHKGRCAGLAVARWKQTPEAREQSRVMGKERRKQYESMKATEAVLDVHDLARDLNRSYRTIWKHAENLGLGERNAPGPHAGVRPLLFDEADIARIRRAVEEHPWSSVYRDPKRRADWYYRRFKSPSQYGRDAKSLGRKEGRGRRTPA